MVPSPPSSLRKTSSRNSFRGDAEQAGRTPTILHAHRSSASLSQVSTSTSSDSSRRRPLSHQRSGSAADSSADRDGVEPRVLQSSAELQGPQLSPQHTPSSDSEQSNSSEEKPVADEPRSRARNAALGAAIAESANLPPPPRIPGSRAGNSSSRGSWASVPRGSTPRSLHDLGADYSRYYNPFSSQNSSVTDLRSPPPGYRTSSQVNLPLLADQEKRHSNPFTDARSATGPEQKGAARDSTVASGVLLSGVPLAAPSGSGVLDPEKSFFPYLDDRLGAPGTDAAGYNFPMLWSEKEDDDDMHMPMVDDDIKMKPKLKDRFTRENICSTFGLVFMILGLLTLFVVLPVLSFSGISTISYYYETPLDQFPKFAKGEAWAYVNDKDYPLLQNVRQGLIDPDTPKSAMTKTSQVDGQNLNLVFSDEFNDQNRTFYKGDDPFWFGADFWYGATQDLEWYTPDAVSTYDGVLQLQLDAYPNHGLQFRSGMLNSWNQMCFKGGIWEVSVSLPGPAGVHGLWPGVWSMGNLGRPGHTATTDGLWPYTYNDCDTGITPNQSMSDGTSRLPGQRLASCICSGEDHPSPGTGRGAPEIDILEGAADYGGQGWGTATQSFQVAPFDIWYYPNYDFFATPNRATSTVNSYTGGPYQQAVSVTSVLNNTWYDGNAYQRYSYDYAPGKDENAFVAWVVGDDIQGVFDGRALGPNGNVQERLVSEEPMSMIINLGMSESWTSIDFARLKFPTIMRVDYVRLYQREGQESVTCDPPGYPTTEYIANHPEAYQNPNYTHWTNIPGYTWPKNTLMNGCSA